MDPVDWDGRYLKMAKLVADWSKDPNARVGAVIVRNNRVVATGFNGFPSEVRDTVERLEDKEKKRNIIVHAEVNAQIVAGRDAEGSCIYVYGKPVCCRCAGSIIQAGIIRVVAMDPEKVDPDSDWYEPGLIARDMFDDANLTFRRMELETSEEVSDSDAPTNGAARTAPVEPAPSI